MFRYFAMYYYNFSVNVEWVLTKALSLRKSIWRYWMVFIRLILTGFSSSKETFLFFNLFHSIILNILTLLFTNICLVFILLEKYYIFNDTNILKIYNILTEALIYFICFQNLQTCMYLYKSVIKIAILSVSHAMQ